MESTNGEMNEELHIALNNFNSASYRVKCMIDAVDLNKMVKYRKKN